MGSVRKVFKKVTKAVKKPVSKITKGIAKGIAKVGKAVIRGVAKINKKLRTSWYYCFINGNAIRIIRIKCRIYKHGSHTRNRCI